MKLFPALKNPKPHFLLALSLIIAMVLAGACSKEELSEEDEVRAVVNEMEAAAEEKDVKGFMKHVSKDFNDDKGNDYDGARGMVFLQFMQAGKLGVFIRKLDVTVEGEKALVDAKVVFVRGMDVEKLEDLLPEDAAGYRFSVVFTKEDGGWKALSSKWGNVGFIGVL